MNIILNKDDPDYIVERFWYGFKQSMINFYVIIMKDYSYINTWSDVLNKMKQNKEYNMIELKIREYMSHYAFDLIKYNDIISYYHDDILISNMKRWNYISTNYNFNSCIIYSRILIVFMIYLEIKKIKNYKFLESLESIENILDTNNFDEFIIFALKNSKSKILELLQKMPNYNLISRINELYPNLNFNKKVKIGMVKIINEYKIIYM